MSLKTVVAACLFLLLPGFNYSDRGYVEQPMLQGEGGRMFQPFESIEYKVSYSFFNLGKIRIRVLDKRVENGRTIYDCDAYIDSAPGLPFVNLHVRYFSQIDEEMFSRGWTAVDSAKDEVKLKRYRFSYEKQQGLIYSGLRNADGGMQVASVDTVALPSRTQDGLSLFFYARAFFKSQRTVSVPTIIEKKIEKTTINFKNEREDMDISAVDYPIDVIFFDGTMDFIGIFGLTGGFRGWFSNDDAGIPIVARMNVYLGSIKVELTQWTRNGWTPPKYVENN